MAEEEKQIKVETAPKKPQESDDGGILLHRFRPVEFKRQRIVLLILMAVFAWMIADFTQIILIYAREETKVPILLTFYLTVLIFTYIYYLIVFDNIGIYERGFTPPLSKERRLWRTIPKFRTFIPFTEISDFDIIDRPEPFTGLVFRALGRNWVISSNWDIFTLVMVLEQGMANRYILDFELDGIVSVPSEVSEGDEITVGVSETQGSQEGTMAKHD